MRRFRKISFIFVGAALFVLTLHFIVPHHHSLLGGDLICTTTNHHHNHTCNTPHTADGTYINCSDEPAADGDMLCTLSHSFLNNPSISHLLIPMVVRGESIVPSPITVNIGRGYIDVNDSVIQKFIDYHIPRRAPPVA